MPDAQPKPPSGLIGSAQRALQVLETVVDGGDGITAKAVARRTGFKLSTTYRLLNTLVHESYIAAEIEEFQPGLACLATPVKNAEGRTTAAVALSVPVKDFTKRRRQSWRR